jgi:lipopolysaccharide/colanic/teichoic acid biosynthesis glycosyltransferase
MLNNKDTYRPFPPTREFIILNISLISAIYLQNRFVLSTAEIFALFSTFNLFWLVSSLFTKKFRRHRPKSLFEGFGRFARAYFYMIFMLFFLIFIVRPAIYSRFEVLFTLLIYAALSSLIYVISYLRRWGLNVQETREANHVFLMAQEKQPEEKKREEVKGIDELNRTIPDSLANKLQGDELIQDGKIKDFMAENLRLEQVTASKSYLFDTNSVLSLNSLISRGWEFLGNVGDLNNFPRINRYFIAANEKLAMGGYLLGVVETFQQRFRRKFSRFPGFLRNPLYGLDFLWVRAFPKITGLKKIYFFFHEKGPRVVSLEEVMGRLVFCGFGEFKFRESHGKTLFLARKIALPLEDSDPSYSFLFKQPRLGLEGETIYVYKLRTMYPYSEYLHKYALERNKLNDIGKIGYDVRITNWGRILRKFWIDELPMLVNWLQGDLKLVGLRPISRSFFAIYPEDLRVERIRFKPGMVPAFYADMPKTIDKIFDAEKRYMERFIKHPIRTDVLYFFRVMFNIFFRKARSA